MNPVNFEIKCICGEDLIKDAQIEAEQITIKPCEECNDEYDIGFSHGFECGSDYKKLKEKEKEI